MIVKWGIKHNEEIAVSVKSAMQLGPVQNRLSETVMALFFSRTRAKTSDNREVKKMGWFTTFNMRKIEDLV